MRYIGNTLMIAGIAAFIAPRLNLRLPEGLTIPTMPTDVLGGLLLLAGIAWKIYEDQN